MGEITWSVIIGVCSILIAVLGVAIDWRGLVGRKKERADHRRLEVAEKALQYAYKIKEMFSSLRHDRLADTQTRLNRITDQKDIFSQFQDVCFEFQTLFGLETTAPFETIIKAYKEFENAAKLLIQIPRKNMDEQKRESLRKILGIHIDPSDKDLFKDKIEDAVSHIEKICRPVIDASFK